MKSKKSRIWLYAIIFFVLAGVTGIVILNPLAWADDPVVGSAELIEEADRFNLRQVVYRGEIIGVVLDRGDNAWITVNDGPYGGKPLRRYQELKGGNEGMGIYCSRDQLESVNFLGSYNAVGDILEISATFYKANPDHGGDLCIVADQVSILREGHHIQTHRLRNELLVAIALGAVLAVLVVLLHRKRRQLRAK